MFKIVPMCVYCNNGNNNLFCPFPKIHAGGEPIKQPPRASVHIAPCMNAVHMYNGTHRRGKNKDDACSHRFGEKHLSLIQLVAVKV